MAEVLVLVDHVDGQVKKVTTELLTAARRVGEPVAVWIGDGVESGKATLAEFGAEKVYVAPAEVNDYVVAPKAELLAKLAQDKGAAAILVSATAENKEIAGRTAVKLGSGVLTDVVDVNAELVTEHSIFGGATVTHARVKTGVPVIAVRPNSVTPEAAAGAAAEEAVSVDISDAALSEFVERVGVMTVYPYLRESIDQSAAKLGAARPTMKLLRPGDITVSVSADETPSTR